MSDRQATKTSRRWARTLAPLMIAGASLVGVTSMAAPAHASNPDGGADYSVIDFGGGDYMYCYDDGRIRFYHDFAFIGEINI